jgi:L-lysine exporter family protein LysE/ArgO
MEKTPFIFGLILQSSMILALGAQNLFVLEKGLLKDRPLLVAAICSICDVSLILVGVLGAGSFFAQNEWLSLAMKLGGAAFLLKYAYAKYREAGGVQKMDSPLRVHSSGFKTILLSTLGVSLLNPHVYLDTVVLIGGYSTQFLTINDKIKFAIGAGLFSVIWFYSLSLGAGYFSSALESPKTMKKINYGASFIMTVLALNLLWSVRS